MEISIIDLTNSLISQFNAKDKELNDLLAKIDEKTQDLSNDDIHNSKKFEIIVGIEYLFTRARVVVETEHIKVKQILSNSSTPKAVTPYFVKRDAYLSQVSLKLTTFRNEIETLQKVVYTNSNFIKK